MEELCFSESSILTVHQAGEPVIVVISFQAFEVGETKTSGHTVIPSKQKLSTAFQLTSPHVSTKSHQRSCDEHVVSTCESAPRCDGKNIANFIEVFGHH